MWLWEIFLKNRKILTPIIKDKKVTYSNSSLKLWKESCHWINTCGKLKERSCGKGSKIYHRSFAKTSKVAFTIANGSVYSNASQYSGAINACKKFASP